MKKLLLLAMVLIQIQTKSFSQYYNVGTSVTGQTDFYGNTTANHYDQDGNKMGRSVTGQTDFYGNTTTNHYDQDGNKAGRSVMGQTDFWSIGQKVG